MTNTAINPTARRAFDNLAGTLTELRAAGRSVPCWTDPDPFTAESADDRAEAAAACTACPALAACSAFATANAEPAHVWGGVDHAKDAEPAVAA